MSLTALPSELGKRMKRLASGAQRGRSSRRAVLAYPLVLLGSQPFATGFPDLPTDLQTVDRRTSDPADRSFECVNGKPVRTHIHHDDAGTLKDPFRTWLNDIVPRVC